MNIEQVEELKQIRKELNIPKNDFLELSGYALNYKEYEKTSMSDEDVFELIKESMMCYDNKKKIKDDPLERKTIEEAFAIACDKIAFESVYMGDNEEMDRDFPSLI